MKKIRAILVDDEASARDVLENLLLLFCPEVEVIAKCETLPEAVKAISEQQPEVVFLDIEMPNYAGYEIVDFFDEIPFHIVFVTAFEKYAIQAFEIAAVDYLLKPVDIERLKSAAARVSERVEADLQAQRLSVLSTSLETGRLQTIVVTDKGQQHLIPVDSIIALEAMEAYCTIHTTRRKFTVSRNLKYYEQQLESNSRFVRTHKSWIIHLDHMETYHKAEGSINMAQGIIARVSRYKKAAFEALIGA